MPKYEALNSRFFPVFILIIAISYGACGREKPEAPLPTPTFHALTGVSRQALLVATGTPADIAIASRLTGLGFEVTSRSGPQVTTADAEGKALVFISESVTSSDVGTKLRDVPVPIVLAEPALLDDMQMVAAEPPPNGWGTTNGDWGNATELDLVNSSHPLAAGLAAGRVSVTSASAKLIWGVPVGTAITIATMPGNSGRFGIFAYESGTPMAGLTAPARRVSLFLGDGGAGTSVADKLTDQGRLLLDAAVRWATEEKPLALLVVGATPLPSADEALRARLAGPLGFDVRVVTAANLSAPDASGKSAIVLSESSSSANIARKLRDVPVGVLTLEPAVADEMGMVGSAWMVDQGDAATQTQIDILDPLHPLAGGLSGRVTVTSTASKFVWGGPKPGAQRVASLAANPTSIGIYGYESGSLMDGLDAPARRVGFFAGDPTPAALTTDGWKLFDAAVKWVSNRRDLSVEPKAVCRVDRGGAVFTAVFGYINTSPGNVRVPLGSRNAIIPSASDRVQPEWLKAGGEAVAFSVNSQGAPVSWTLAGKVASVSASSPLCAVQPGPEGEQVLVAGVAYTIAVDPAKVAVGKIQNTPVGATPGLAGTSSVSADGAFLYDIPIDVPAGRAGIQPQLSVGYNSKGSGGNVGVGFSLRGLSEIRRCRTNLRQDEAVKPIALNSVDAICLDGQRLIPVDGPQAAPVPLALAAGFTLTDLPDTAIEYRTERDPVTRIFRINGLAANPVSFIIFQRDGRIARYAAPEYEAPGPDAIVEQPTVPPQQILWPLKELRDRHGNKMTVKYIERGAGSIYEVLPRSIAYTGRYNVEGERKVVFTWVSKSLGDQWVSYVAGITLGSTQRLSNIAIFAPDLVQAGSPITRDYSFFYEQSPATGKDRLREVREGAAADGFRPPLVFQWENGETGFDRIETGIERTDFIVPLDTPGIGIADLDGDGFDDFLHNDANGQTTYYLNQRSGTYFNGQGSTKRTLTFGSQPFTSPIPIPVDLDGDGVSELVRGDTCGRNQIQYSVLTFKKNNAEFAPAPSQPFGSTGCLAFKQSDLRFADMDGNGLPDRILGGHDADYLVALNPLLPIGSYLTASPGRSSTTSFLSVADLDGDGVPNLTITPSASGVAEFNGDGIADVVSSAGVVLGGTGTVVPVPGFPPTNGNYRIGDFDGDGHADLLILDGSDANGNAPIMSARSNTFLASGSIAAPENFVVSTRKELRFQRRCWRITPGGGSTPCSEGGASEACPVEACCSEGCAPICKSCQEADFPVDVQTTADGYGYTRTLDVNGDGLSDVIQVDWGGYTFAVYRKKGKKPDLLRGVTTGEGATEAVAYSHMGDRGATSPTHPHPFYQPATNPADCKFPLACIKRGNWMVKRVDRDAGREAEDGTKIPGFIREEYSYEDGRADVVGRGWLGFSRTRMTQSFVNSQADTAGDVIADVDTRYERFAMQDGNDFPFAFLPTDVRTRRSTCQGTGTRTGCPTRGTRTTLGARGPGDTLDPGFAVRRGAAGASGLNSRVYRVDVTKTESAAYEAGHLGSTDLFATGAQRTILSTQSFDDFANREYDETTVLGLGGTQRSKKTRTFLFDDDGRFLGLPRQTTTTDRYTPPGEPESSVTRSAAMVWNYSLGDLEERTIQPNGSDDERVTERFTRNADGLVVEERAEGRGSSGSLESRTSSIKYDAREGMYPIEVRNPMGHVSKAIYLPAVDQSIWESDENGITTTKVWDRFGLLQSSRGPGNNVLTIGRQRVGGRLLTEIAPAQGITQRVRTDRLGRPVERYIEQFNGSYARYRTLFDQRGRAYAETGPYTADRVTFDGLDRPVKIETVGSEAFLSNPNAEAFRTQNIVYFSFYRDLYEEVTSSGVTKNNATDRDELGQVVRREETLTRPGHGPQVIVSKFSYRPFGDLGSVDVDGQLTTMQYDALGRRKGLTTPDSGLHTSAYDAFGELVLEGDRAQKVRRYLTDGLGRVTMQIDQFDGILASQAVSSFEHDTAPNGLGLPASTRSSDGILDVFAYEPRFSGLSRLHRYVQGEGPFEIAQAFDSFGRVQKVTYPETPGFPRFELENVFGDYDGQVRLVKRPGTPNEDALWQVTETDQLRRPTREVFGNGAVRTQSFAPDRGWLDQINTRIGSSDLQRLAYAHSSDGTITGRADAVIGLREGFRYDSLNRLASWFDADASGVPTGAWSVDYDIDSRGNLRGRTTQSQTHGSEVVTNSYAGGGNAGPHAVTSSSLWSGEIGYDPAGNVVNHPRLGSLDYTHDNLPRHVSGNAFTPSADFLYDGDGTRARKRVGGDNGLTTLYMGGMYERRREGSDTPVHVLYLGSFGQLVRTGGGTAGAKEVFTYFFQDHLGSPDVVATTSSAGVQIAREKRDPFGNRLPAIGPEGGGALNPRLDASVRGQSIPSDLTLGFTGHEGEDDLGLVNMRGRIYDARLGRMLQADPFIQEPFLSQSHNRFSYAWNNPVTNVDPSGFLSQCYSYVREDTGETVEVCIDVVQVKAKWQPKQSNADYTANGSSAGFIPNSGVGAGGGGGGQDPSDRGAPAGTAAAAAKQIRDDVAVRAQYNQEKAALQGSQYSPERDALRAQSRSKNTPFVRALLDFLRPPKNEGSLGKANPRGGNPIADRTAGIGRNVGAGLTVLALALAARQVANAEPGQRVREGIGQAGAIVGASLLSRIGGSFGRAVGALAGPAGPAASVVLSGAGTVAGAYYGATYGYSAATSAFDAF